MGRTSRPPKFEPCRIRRLLSVVTSLSRSDRPDFAITVDCAGVLLNLASRPVTDDRNDRLAVVLLDKPLKCYLCVSGVDLVADATDRVMNEPPVLYMYFLLKSLVASAARDPFG